MSMRNIYLDNNATTSIAPEVREAMMPFLSDLWGNPSSMHTFGGQVQKYVERAREQVAALINADPSEIIFTSCGSESDNMAIRGSVEAMGGHPHIVTTRVEHAAVLAMCQYLEKRGCPVTWLNVDTEGRLDLEEVKHSLRPDTAVVSVMWANNETGVVFPIDEIAQIVKAAGRTFHTDAVQAVGKIPVDVRKTPIDMLALSGHKLHAPKGVGAIYIRKGTRVNPLIIGGHQEFGKRAGTENVPYIVALGAACELAAKHMDEENTRVKTLRDKLEEGILKSCPDVRINGDREHRLPNTLNVSFEFIEGESILLDLDEVGVAASSGSACTSGSLEPSHVMRAMGVPFTAAHGSIRFSFSRYNIEADVDHVLKHIPAIVKRLRIMSPFVPNGKNSDKSQ
jgi:cysteine desulfurase